jgi:hypothetical protein
MVEQTTAAEMVDAVASTIEAAEAVVTPEAAVATAISETITEGIVPELPEAAAAAAAAPPPIVSERIPENEPERKRKKTSRFSDAPDEAVPGQPMSATAAAMAAATQVKLLAQGMAGIGGFIPQMPQIDEKTLKTMTELFVGNMPPGASSEPLAEFINQALLETKMNTSPGNPVTTCRHNPGSKFAFLVFRSVEETTNALNLTGIPFMTTALKIERPGNFAGPKTGAMTWQQLTGIGASAIPTIGPSLTPGAFVPDPVTKPLRELFIGNIVEGTAGNDIHEFLGAVMQEVGLGDSTKEGNPIINVRTNGKFAFIELRSVEEASNALNMGPYRPFETCRFNVRPCFLLMFLKEHPSWPCFVLVCRNFIHS